MNQIYTYRAWNAARSRGIEEEIAARSFSAAFDRACHRSKLHLGDCATVEYVKPARIREIAAEETAAEASA